MSEEKAQKHMNPFAIMMGIMVVIQFFIIGAFFKDPIVEFVNAYFPSEEVNYNYPLDSIHVNLADEENRHFLRTSLHFSGSLQDGLTTLEENESKVKASVIELLREKKLEDINNVDSTKQLEQEIISTVNTIVGDHVVDTVYLVEFLYQ